MFRKFSNQERIDLAKAKTKKVVDHLVYLIKLHANNSCVVYSPMLSSQIPRSFAANAFNVFQRSMHQYEIVRLCALWDSPKIEKENIPTVAGLIDDDAIIEILAEETRGHWADIGGRILNSSGPDFAALENDALKELNKQFGIQQAIMATT